MSKLPKKSIIVGDFNYPGIDWNTYVCDNMSTDFVNVVQEQFYEQLINEPTHSGGNILDLVLTKTPENVHDCKVVSQLGNSDHFGICITLPNKNVPKVSHAKKVPNYAKADWDSIQAFFAHIDFKSEFETCSVEEMWEFLISKIKTSESLFVPLKRQKRLDQPPWMSDKILRLIRKKKTFWKRGKDDLSFKQVQKELRYAIRRAKLEHEKKVSELSRKHSKLFYNYLNSRLKNKSTIGPLLSNNQSITDPLQQSMIFNDYFSSVYRKDPVSRDNVFLSHDNSDTPIQFNIAEVHDVLKQLNKDSAPGPDGVSNTYLFNAKDYLCLPLQLLFNASLKTSQLPSAWKMANVTPVHKAGKKSDASNYRPISLTSSVCKIMETLISQKLDVELEQKGIIPDTQHGFTKRKNCTTNLLEFYDKVTRSLDTKECLDAIYLDFRKAFDLVSHQKLIDKLESLGISQVLISWVSNWLSGRRQRVVLNGSFSPWTNVPSGVIQGSQLGPKLFLIFVSDIPDCISQDIFLSMYADDSKLLGPARIAHDGLQSTLNKLEHWCQVNAMEFNIGKCKVIHFGHSNIQKDYFIKGIKLESTEALKDLGVLVDRQLKFSSHVQMISKRANSILGQIRRCFSFRTKLVFLNLYKTFVRSQMEHAVQVWNPWLQKDIDTLEKVQKRALRMISDFPTSANTYDLKLKELRLISLHERRERGDAIQTFKIIRGIDNVTYSQWFRFTSEVNIRDSRSVSEAKLEIPFARTDVRKYFFSVRACHIWNLIPNSFRQNISVREFKIGYDRFKEDEKEGIKYFVL